MRYYISAVPNAKTANVEILTDEYHLRIKIDAPAKENKANVRLLEILAEYLKVPFGRLRFVSGLNSKTKVIELI